ncbi:MAG: TusE/DsrC/DsvC family sulfur relay protein [Desulfobacterales bacterium]
MSNAQQSYEELEFDESGLLKEPDVWNEEVAQMIADQDEIGTLTEDHWKMIQGIRRYYHKYGVPPMEGRLCMVRGMDEISVHSLFKNCLMVWRIAGLPDPGEEAKAYMNK